MKIRDIICEYYYESDDRKSWEDIEDWDKVSENHKNRLMNTFDDAHEMMDLMTAGNANNLKYSTYDEDLKCIAFSMYDDPEGDDINNSDINQLYITYYLKENFIEFGGLYTNSEKRTLATGLKIIRQLMKFCKRLGITLITTHAAEDGSAMWPRIGFYPYNIDMYDMKNIQDNLSHLHNNKLITPEEHAKYTEIIKKYQNNPEMIWILAVEKHGHELLKNTEWSGKLDMNNPKCMERLRRFVRI